MTDFEKVIQTGIIDRLLNSYTPIDNNPIISPGPQMDWFKGECVGYLKDCLATGRVKREHQKEIHDKIAGFVVGISGGCTNTKQDHDLTRCCQILFCSCIKFSQIKGDVYGKD